MQSDGVARSNYGLRDVMPTWFILLIAVGASALALRQLRRRSADRRGALRVMMATFTLRAIYDGLRAHAGLYANPVLPFFVISDALFFGFLFGTLYLAFEPFARRIWPTVMVSWSRLLGGETIRWKDPTVGRSILVGMFCGAAMTLAYPLLGLLIESVSNRPPVPVKGDWTIILGHRASLATIASSFNGGIFVSCAMVFLLVLARSLVRRQVLAVLLTALGFLAIVGSDDPRNVPGVYAMITFALISMIALGAMLRYGLLALVATMVVFFLSTKVPTHDWSAWHAQPAITTMVVLAAIAAFAYRAATAGRGLIPAEGHRP